MIREQNCWPAIDGIVAVSYHESFHIIEAQRTVPINTIDLTAAVLVVIIISHGDEMLLILSEDFEIGVY